MTDLSIQHNKDLEAINHDRFAGFALKVAERYHGSLDYLREATQDIMFYYNDTRFAEDKAILEAHPEALRYFVTSYLNSIRD